MNVAIVNLGCKVNRVESDSIAAAYQARGAHLSDVASADMIVVNTCTVTGEAEKKTRKTIRRVLRDNSQASVLVTGCAAVIDPDFFSALDERVRVVEKSDLLDQESHGEASTSYPVRVGESFPTRVAVKVQDGCNHSCSYCIVHVARGKAWSRPYREIIEEVCLLAKHGVKEVVLAGIDLGSYVYSEGDERVRLGLLVRMLLDELDARGYEQTRLRISSIEPRSIDRSFVEVLAQAQGRVCRHLHLPLQSGSDRVLKEMNRPYTSSDFLDLVNMLKERVGDISLTTDVIVGFPGETEEDFENTCRVVSEVGFTKVHVFRYSKREGTPAAERVDQVLPEVKEERAHRLLELSDELRSRYLTRNADREETIVVEKAGWGMSESYYKVRVKSTLKAGSVCRASLTDADPFGMVSL
ncbi:MAG: tRNA (N(6)-L-threonylcarbamoyladenosine(37)-C(2))-methylthiotransferase MtaB [Eggerthellaceae bacterium]